MLVYDYGNTSSQTCSLKYRFRALKNVTCCISGPTVIYLSIYPSIYLSIHQSIDRFDRSIDINLLINLSTSDRQLGRVHVRGVLSPPGYACPRQWPPGNWHPPPMASRFDLCIYQFIPPPVYLCIQRHLVQGRMSKIDGSWPYVRVLLRLRYSWPFHFDA